MTPAVPPSPLLVPSFFSCCSLALLQLPATPTVEYVRCKTPVQFFFSSKQTRDQTREFVEGGDGEDAEDKGGGGGDREHAGRGGRMWFLSGLLSGVKPAENH